MQVFEGAGRFKKAMHASCCWPWRHVASEKTWAGRFSKKVVDGQLFTWKKAQFRLGCTEMYNLKIVSWNSLLLLLSVKKHLVKFLTTSVVGGRTNALTRSRGTIGKGPYACGLSAETIDESSCTWCK